MICANDKPAVQRPEGPTITDPGPMGDRMRQIIIERSFPVRSGHIGSCLSIVEILVALFDGVLRRNHDTDSDAFILSKGHAALALYAALYCTGEIGDAELESYCRDGSAFGEHPDHAVKGIEFSTGSLGMGLSMGAGLALAAELQTSARRVFVLMSDAEMNEGAVWEACMFAAHHRLANLVAIVDLNGQQAMGTTTQVLDLTRAADIWQAFGWDVHEVDGHDSLAIQQTLATLAYQDGAPHVLLAKTISGHRVPFMEHKIGWHYWSMDQQQYEDALRFVRTTSDHEG